MKLHRSSALVFYKPVAFFREPLRFSSNFADFWTKINRFGRKNRFNHLKVQQIKSFFGNDVVEILEFCEKLVKNSRNFVKNKSKNTGILWKLC